MNQTFSTSTTEFFSKDSYCFFSLQTYEDNDAVILNVTFTKVTSAAAYLIYKKHALGSSYQQEQVILAAGENFTYSFRRSELSDKRVYIVASGLGKDPAVEFATVRSDIPVTIPDNSFIATIAVTVMGLCVVIIIVIKGVEVLEEYLRTKGRLTRENSKFQSRLGIDFEIDRRRLDQLAQKTREKFQTACLKYKNLLSN